MTLPSDLHSIEARFDNPGNVSSRSGLQQFSVEHVTIRTMRVVRAAPVDVLMDGALKTYANPLGISIGRGESVLQ